MISVTAVLRICNDPETRDAAGTPVVSFRGASNEKRKGEEHSTFLGCSFFGERATKVSQYIRKGDKIAVSGTLSTREYTAKDGTTRTSLELRVQELELLGTKPKDGETRPSNGASSGAVVDDLPF